jgi:hypothetical protein
MKQITYQHSCAMDQAVSHQPFGAQVWVQSQASPHEICGGQNGTCTGSSPSTSVFLSVLFHQCTRLIHDVSKEHSSFTLKAQRVKEEQLFVLDSLAMNPTTQPQVLQSHGMFVQWTFVSEKQYNYLTHLLGWRHSITYLRMRSWVKAERPAYVLIGTSSLPAMMPPSRFTG